MPPGVGVVGADAHQPMHADFAVHHARGPLALHHEGDRADARLFAVGAVHFGDIPVFFLPELQVHPEKHGGPVAGLRAAGAGMNLHVAIRHVVRAGEQRLKFDLGVVALDLVEHVVGFVDGGLIPGLATKLVKGFHVFEFFFNRKKRLDFSAGKFEIFDDLLGGVLVVPEALGAHLFFEFFDVGLACRHVKASRGCFASAP